MNLWFASKVGELAQAALGKARLAEIAKRPKALALGLRNVVFCVKQTSAFQETREQDGRADALLRGPEGLRNSLIHHHQVGEHMSPQRVLALL